MRQSTVLAFTAQLLKPRGGVSRSTEDPLG